MGTSLGNACLSLTALDLIDAMAVISGEWAAIFRVARVPCGVYVTIRLAIGPTSRRFVLKADPYLRVGWGYAGGGTEKRSRALP